MTGSICQQTSLYWKRWQRGVVGEFVVDCGNSTESDGVTRGYSARGEPKTLEMCSTSDILKGGEKKPEQMGGSQQDTAGAEGGCQHSYPQSA